MATAQINGSAVTNTSTKNNKGTIRNGGTIAASTKWQSKKVGDTKYDLYGTGPKLNTTSLSKSITAGVFATMTKGRYIIRKVTGYLANVVNTKLQSGASDYGHRKAIHKIESMRMSFLYGLSWTGVSGSVVYTMNKSNTNTAYGNDDAARPTLAVPGEFTYLVSGKLPTRADYSRKTSA